jgi:hypothetical protein
MNAPARGHAQTTAARAARHASTQAALQRVRDAITRIRRQKTPVTVAAVARQAGVSRTFLYANPQARAAVTDATARYGTRQAQDLADRDTEQEAPWRERALNAENALKTARAEIISQRNRIGELMGQVRDLETEWTEQATQRITTENTTLKQRVRQLTADNRTLDERLTAARTNLRFQDRRLAGLEAQLTDPSPAPPTNPPPIPPDHAERFSRTRPARPKDM